jgi:tRNA(fMet)-specific endonuclease VapC
MVVLDTDFVIDLMRGHPGAVAHLENLLERPDPAGISAITVMQLYHGVARVDLEEEERDRVEAALKGMTVYDMTRPIAVRAGLVDGELMRRGEPIDPADVIVGATALHRGEPVVTRNKKHFGRMKGLKVIGY